MYVLSTATYYYSDLSRLATSVVWADVLGYGVTSTGTVSDSTKLPKRGRGLTTVISGGQGEVPRATTFHPDKTKSGECGADVQGSECARYSTCNQRNRRRTCLPQPPIPLQLIEP